MSLIKCIRWAVDLGEWQPSLNQLILAVSSIQSEEKERISKFVFREDFNASLVGRLMMRKFVNAVTDIPYKSIIFKRDSHGKPYLENKLNPDCHLCFNVSHQGKFSVLAGIFYKKSELQTNELFSNKNIEIGTDIMKFEYSGGKQISEFFRIMNRNFSEEEWITIRNKNDEFNQLKTFMRFWCLKESFVKCIGVGITIDLRKISFNVKSQNLNSNDIVSDTEVKVNNELQKEWKFEESLLDEDHCVAIAFKNWNELIDRESFVILDSEELLKNCIPLIDKDETYCLNVLKKQYKYRKF